MKACTESTKGSAIVIALLVVLIGAVLIGTLATAANQRAYSARKLDDRMRAKAVAESAAQQVYSVLQTNFDLRFTQSAFPTSSYGGGTYGVGISNPASGTTNTAIVTVTGNYAGASVVVAMNIVNTNPASSDGGGGGGGGGGGSGGSGGSYAGGCAVLAGGNMSIAGSGSFNVGSNGIFHSNGNISKSGSGNFQGGQLSCVGTFDNAGSGLLQGTNIWIGGNITASGSAKLTGDNLKGDAVTRSGSGNWTFRVLNVLTHTLSGSGATYGTLTTNMPSTVTNMTIPTLDLTPYYNVAVSNGQVFSNRSISGSSEIGMTGGVMWVNGTLSISGSGGRKGGCIIATGNITISGSGNFSHTNGYPLLISRDGNINISGSGQYSGLMFAGSTSGGTFSKSGSGNVQGQIVSRSTFTASGSWSALAYSNCTPAVPSTGGGGGGGGGGGSTSAVAAVISVWQK